MGATEVPDALKERRVLSSASLRVPETKAPSELVY